jgi:hypothetical protein
MRRDDRPSRSTHGVEERRIRNMRDVDHHPEVVHPGHHPPAERREPAVPSVVARASADAVRVRPRERHVARAAVVEDLQAIEELIACPLAERMSTLDPDEERDLARPGRRAHLCGRARQDDRRRVRCDEPVDGVELGESPRVEGIFRIHHRRHEDGEKLGVQASLAHARNVRLTIRETLGEVRALEDEPLGYVVVGVDHDGGAVQRFGGLGFGSRLESGLRRLFLRWHRRLVPASSARSEKERRRKAGPTQLLACAHARRVREVRWPRPRFRRTGPGS